jgi:WD40 repeat protein/serine/threonine protein kinase
VHFLHRIANTGDLIDGRYKYIADIGQGGMGLVIRAQDTRFDERVAPREVAIKGFAIANDLHQDLTTTQQVDQHIASFNTELVALSKFHHPNIIKIFDVGIIENSHPYVVMELMDHGTLHARLNNHEIPLLAVERIQILRDICAAVDYINENGILHGDLKPSNILLDASGNAVVSDFGIAKPYQELSGGVGSTSPAGTPGYLAPELNKGGPVTRQADIYALGKIAWQLFTRQGPNDTEEVRCSLEPGLEEALRKAFADRPLARYSSAMEFLAAVESYEVELNLDEAAQRWARRSRPTADLYRAERLIQAETQLLSNSSKTLVREFIRESRAAADHENAQKLAQAQRVVRIRTAALIITSILLLTATLASIFAFNQQQLAEAAANDLSTEIVVRSTAEAVAVENGNIAIEREAEANSQRQLAEAEALRARISELTSESRALRQDNPQLSLLMAIEAAKSGSDPHQAETIAAKNNLVQILTTIGGQGLSGHQGRVIFVEFSKDNRWLATASTEGMIRLWDLQSTNPSSEPVVLHVDYSIRAMQFTPDGKRLIASIGYSNTNFGTGVVPFVDALFNIRESSLLGEDPADRESVNYIYVWNLTDSKFVEDPDVFQAHDKTVIALDISPDGHWLATGGFDYKARLWDISQGISENIQPIGEQTYKGTVPIVRFSHDSHWLVTISNVREAEVWDLTASDQDFKKFRLENIDGFIINADFSPDGRWFAAVGLNNASRLWDFTAKDISGSGRALESRLTNVVSLAFSPDSHWLVAGPDEPSRSIAVWDLTSDTPTTSTHALVGHDASNNSLSFSPGGHWLASSSVDHTVRLWNFTDKPPLIASAVLRAHDDQVIVNQFSFDGRWLATGSLDGTARLWNMEELDNRTNQQLPIAALPLSLPPHKQLVGTLSISADSKWLVTGSNDNSSQILDLSRLSQISWLTTALPVQHLEEHTNNIYRVAISPDSKYFATASDDKTIRLWPLNNSISSSINTFSGFDDLIYYIAFSPDGKFLAATSNDASVRLLSLATPNTSEETQPTFLTGQTAEVSALAFSPDGKLLIGGGKDRDVFLWDLSVTTSSSRNAIRLNGHLDEILDVNVSPNGNWIATSGADNTIRLWRLRQPDEPAIVLRGHQDYIIRVIFSPDSHWLASLSFDGSVRLWDLTSSNPATLPVVLRGHYSYVFDGQFTPDNQSLITIGIDGTARLWDLNSLEPVVLSGNQYSLFSISVSNDNEWLSVGNSRGSTLLWPLNTEKIILLACQVVGRNISLSEWERFFPGQDYRLTCPDLPIHPGYILEAQLIAQQGEIEHANNLLRVAVEIEPQLNIKPEVMVNKYAALGHLYEAKQTAVVAGDLEATIAHLQAALNLDPTLDFDATFEAGRLYAPFLVGEATQLIENGNVNEGLLLLKRASQYDPELILTYSDLYAICKWGSLWNRAQDTITFCDLLYAQDPTSNDDPYFRYIRSRARALIGDYQGALDDLQFFVDWWIDNGYDAIEIEEEQRWIDILLNGRNPFTAIVLEELRK